MPVPAPCGLALTLAQSAISRRKEGGTGGSQQCANPSTHEMSADPLLTGPHSRERVSKRIMSHSRSPPAAAAAITQMVASLKKGFLNMTLKTPLNET